VQESPQGGARAWHLQSNRCNGRRVCRRGITLYVFTWNVFTFGADGKHGITNDMGNDITKKYFRATVREMVKTYPLLGGMGITAGEGMTHDMDAKVKEAWLWDTYGEGVRDALKEDPKRKFNMIHRFHWTAQSEILDAFKDYPGTFDFSFKYSVAHMYSITKPPFVQPLLENIAPGMRTWLTVRNDDIYTFRYGDPAYARETSGEIRECSTKPGGLRRSATISDTKLNVIAIIQVNLETQ
jgi:hypothetical protein